jgi:hypothetical protein
MQMLWRMDTEFPKMAHAIDLSGAGNLFLAATQTRDDRPGIAPKSRAERKRRLARDWSSAPAIREVYAREVWH